MVHACRICPYDEIAENKCVYRNDLLTVTKYAFRSFAFLPLSARFSRLGSRRELQLTLARIQLWCIPFTLKTVNCIYKLSTASGSLKYGLSKLREYRVLIYHSELR